jgi:hypothetical protein
VVTAGHRRPGSRRDTPLGALRCLADATGSAQEARNAEDPTLEARIGSTGSGRRAGGRYQRSPAARWLRATRSRYHALARLEQPRQRLTPSLSAQTPPGVVWLGAPHSSQFGQPWASVPASGRVGRVAVVFMSGSIPRRGVLKLPRRGTESV